MNAYFKGFMPNMEESETINASGVKEPPVWRNQTEPGEPPQSRVINVEKTAEEDGINSAAEPMAELSEAAASEDADTAGLSDTIIKFNGALSDGINNDSADEYSGSETGDVDYSDPVQAETRSIEFGGSGSVSTPYTGSGTLLVQVFMARRAVPLENVRVTIRSSDDMPVKVNEILFTDKDGKTAPVSLPTPEGALSQHPESSIQPYAIYTVTAQLDGYTPENEIKFVPVFDGVRSIQNVIMIPKQEQGV
ncbi:MAG TPA: hypothetical protein H9900_04240 [Candidatus Monoglobus merdigallinarum]|uniref:Carboxypeptidase regulatory-like domain-containing protein n=1 Tax=Candidatus Monoglobus merdigallinarum TaxID=2838698 RepID=A0A9D1PQE9_9FIRM|nr:hypothetical protein [Candidatus Monoglobus merdigallinarum]